jgi:hypothetical protein
MAEKKLKPIKGYAIITFPYGETWHICDTCGMAVAPEQTSSHVKFDHDPSDPNFLKPMPGWTVTSYSNGATVHVCDTCGQAQSRELQGLRSHLRSSHPAAYRQLQLSDRLHRLVTEFGIEAVVKQVEKIRQTILLSELVKTPAKKAVKTAATRSS